MSRSKAIQARCQAQDGVVYVALAEAAQAGDPCPTNRTLALRLQDAGLAIDSDHIDAMAYGVLRRLLRADLIELEFRGVNARRVRVSGPTSGQWSGWSDWTPPPAAGARGGVHVAQALARGRAELVARAEDLARPAAIPTRFALQLERLRASPMSDTAIARALGLTPAVAADYGLWVT